MRECRCAAEFTGEFNTQYSDENLQVQVSLDDEIQSGGTSHRWLVPQAARDRASR
jgi:hypothetical protein